MRKVLLLWAFVLSAAIIGIINQLVYVYILQRQHEYDVIKECSKETFVKNDSGRLKFITMMAASDNNEEEITSNNRVIDGAVCFFGKLIPLPSTAKSIHQHLINQNINRLHHYIHSPDLAGTNKLRHLAGDKYSMSLIDSAINISSYEPPIELIFSKTANEFYVKAMGDSRVGPMYPNQLLQMWGVHRCGEMINSFENANKFKYKWIIFSRPDLLWIDDHIALEQLDEEFAWIPHIESDFLGYYDRHFVLNRKHAEIVFERWNKLNNILLPPPRLASIPEVENLENYFTPFEISESVRASASLYYGILNMEKFGKFYYSYNNITVKRFRASCFLTCLSLGDESQYHRSFFSNCKDKTIFIPYLHKYVDEVLEAIISKNVRFVHCRIILPYFWVLSVIIPFILYSCSFCFCNKLQSLLTLIGNNVYKRWLSKRV